MIVQKVYRSLVSRQRKFVLHTKAIISFLNDLRVFKTQVSKTEETEFPINGYYPFIFDKYKESGNFIQHYFEQDLLMAQRVFHNKPERHVDLGSRVDGFVTHVAAFRPIEVLDIRPIERNITNVIFRQADLMKLPKELINYTDSISSLHVIEHFGLGRYGDPIDINGHIKALDNLYLILKPGGKFYLSVPIGKQGIMFNAHRLFTVDYLVRLLEKRYKIDHFHFIDDADKLHYNEDAYSSESSTSFGCTFGCALFELTKA